MDYKKRIIFVNLHGSGLYLKTSTRLLLKKSIAVKHGFFLNYLIKHPDIEVCSFITEDGFSLINNLPRLIMRVLNCFRFMEHNFVMHKNNIPSKCVTVLRSLKQIREDDILIMSPHSKISKEIQQKDIFKVITLTHAFGYKEESSLMRIKNPQLVYAESDILKKSALFGKNFRWYNGKRVIIPFVAKSRFQRLKPFAERENRCISVGTITYRNTQEFIETYGNECFHPQRKQIFDNQDRLQPWIACYNSNYYEENIKEYLPSDNLFTHYKKVWYNTLHTGRQKQYFSFNMVEKFNEFKMCIVGEEILGVPGIGFVEGMACGCAYIGQKCGYYEDYGMKEGVHYIGYDGTLEDLKAKISYYQQPEHQEELECIANAGYEYAQSHFRGEIVAKELLEKIVKAQKIWLASHKTST